MKDLNSDYRLEHSHYINKLLYIFQKILCFFEDAVDLLVNGFDVVLLDAEHTVRDARTVFVGEVKGAEGLRSGNELGSVGKVAGAEGRVVGEGNVDFGEVASDGGSVPDCHLSIKIIKITY